MNLTQLGYFSKPHGIKGNLVLRNEHPFLAEQVRVLFVDQQGSQAPYFISSIKPANQGFIVVLEDIDSVDKALGLVGKKVMVDASLVTIEEEDSWLGYELIDKHFGSMGTIQEVGENGQQTLLTLKFRDREVILPFVDEFIQKIDDTTRQIFFAAPEGLIELYLEDDTEE